MHFNECNRGKFSPKYLPESGRGRGPAAEAAADQTRTKGVQGSSKEKLLGERGQDVASSIAFSKEQQLQEEQWSSWGRGGGGRGEGRDCWNTVLGER